MNANQKAVLRTLLYFDTFSHPLNKTELYELISTNPGREKFENDLVYLIEKQLIGIESGYFYLVNGSSSIFERIKKMQRAGKYQRIARYISALIYLHPFVRGVLISGSLSKNALSKKDDIDFFVIAQPGRIWLCRACLMLFKKIFLLNSKKYFCINYFIDSLSLEIPEKNIFTATELAFLIPLRNPELCRRFLDENAWVRSFFPNLTFKLNGCRDSATPFLKKMVEWILGGKTGDKLDTRFMEIYRKRALRRFGHIESRAFDLNFRSEKNVAKHHPNGYQHAILERYEERIAEFESANQMNLSI